MPPLPDSQSQAIERFPVFVPDYFQALKELEVGDGSMLKDIARQFLSETQARSERLSEAIAQRDLEEAFSLSHTLKGSLATFGLSRAAEVARQMERAADACDEQTLLALEPLLGPALAPGRSHLESELASM